MPPNKGTLINRVCLANRILVKLMKILYLLTVNYSHAICTFNMVYIGMTCFCLEGLKFLFGGRV